MKDALDDLSPLARRDELSASEQQQLELLLNSSEEARIFHELGERFDAEDAAPAAKSAATEALVERLMRELPQRAARPSRKVRRPVWLLAAAAVLAASVAGAVLGARLLGSRGAPAPPASSASSSASPGSRSATGASPNAKPETAPAPSETAPSEATSDAAPGEATSGAAASAGAPPPSAPAPSSATELLSAAGRARRTGQSALAVELLQSLRSRYPNSAEAIASDITLGKLELERGAATAALSHFDDYLRRAAGGALAPEALWGRAQALTKLGRASEARTSLSQLLERYPSSPYASSARAKLGEGSRP